MLFRSVALFYSLKLGRLVLQNNDIGGQLPASIVNLGNLEVIDVEENAIRGTIPAGFATGLTNLRYLNLSRNFFAGR